MDNIRFNHEIHKLTKKQQIDLLNSLGFEYSEKKCNNPHNQPVFLFVKLKIEDTIKRNVYVSYDVDSHCGGTWKAAKSPKDLMNNKSRFGTFNKDFSEKLGK